MPLDRQSESRSRGKQENTHQHRRHPATTNRPKTGGKRGDRKATLHEVSALRRPAGQRADLCSHAVSAAAPKVKPWHKSNSFVQAGRAAEFLPVTQSGLELSEAQVERIIAMFSGRPVLAFDGDDAGRDSAAGYFRASSLVPEGRYRSPCSAMGTTRPLGWRRPAGEHCPPGQRTASGHAGPSRALTECSAGLGRSWPRP